MRCRGYCPRAIRSLRVIAEENGDMERDYAYTIGRAMAIWQAPNGSGPSARAAPYPACRRASFHHESVPVIRQ